MCIHPQSVASAGRAGSFEADIRAGRLHRDMNFHQRVWAVVARIPPGKVATYAQVAGTLGSRAFRAVGSALNRNPYAPAVPCHRVVGKGGNMVGFAGGLAEKRRLLEAEGIPFAGRRVDLESCQAKL